MSIIDNGNLITNQNPEQILLFCIRSLSFLFLSHFFQIPTSKPKFLKVSIFEIHCGEQFLPEAVFYFLKCLCMLMSSTYINFLLLLLKFNSTFSSVQLFKACLLKAMAILSASLSLSLLKLLASSCYSEC